MTARALNIDPSTFENENRRRRTGWSFGVSTVLHILAFLLLTAAKPAMHQAENLVEVTLLDGTGGEPSVAAAPAAAPSSGAVSTGAQAPSEDTRFRRAASTADLEPTPQSDFSIADQISSRLAAMRESNTPISAGTQLGASPSLLSSPAGVPDGGAVGTPVSLSRGGGTGSSGLTLGRGGAATGSALGGVAGAPTTAAVRAAAAPDEEKAAQRVASANLMGPISDRRVVHQVNPVFPEWAKRDGVEGSVTLYFIVRADGEVAENVLVQKTSGFGDFDENARAALREWRFEPLHGGRTGDQWGTITLNFRLRNS